MQKIKSIDTNTHVYTAISIDVKKKSREGVARVRISPLACLLGNRTLGRAWRWSKQLCDSFCTTLFRCARHCLRKRSSLGVGVAQGRRGAFEGRSSHKKREKKTSAALSSMLPPLYIAYNLLIVNRLQGSVRPRLLIDDVLTCREKIGSMHKKMRERSPRYFFARVWRFSFFSTP